MRLLSTMRVLLVLIVLSPSAIFAQSSQAVSSASVPRLISIGGVFRPADGQPAAAVETVTLSIYADQEGGAPLWQETQSVALDAQGRYELLLGATEPDGIPAAVFGSGDAHWLGTVFERAGEVEGPRVRITSVPYALRAADADTLGGRPAADYLLVTTAARDGLSADAPSVNVTAETRSDVVQSGTPNFLAKYINTADIGNSAVFENNGLVGIGTTTPLDSLHLRFTNTNGGATGLAVQNLGGTATSYSGMLFYDQNGALGQFQGFNNSTHEYRINNVARVSPGGAFNGSINFMVGSSSRFLVASNGNIGIGTTAPSALLEVSNAVPGNTVPSNVWTTSYTNFLGPYYMARRARGTPGAPAAVQSGDGLAGFYGQGYGTTAFGPAFTGGMTVQAAQNWTNSAQGTALTFTTTSINANSPTTRMTLDATGNLGIGTTTVPAAGLLEVSNASNSNTTGTLVATTYANSATGSSALLRKARGTAASPLAVQANDNLALFAARGYGATGFGSGGGGMLLRAAENWTDAAQGIALDLRTTATGTNAPTTRMTIAANGNVGIGTTNPDASLGIARNGNAAVATDAFGTGVLSGVVARTSRGTQAAPTAVQAGDLLGFFAVSGGDGSGSFDDFQAGMVGYAAETWTPTTRGAGLGFFTTPIGLPEDPDEVPKMVILPSGAVGIGTPLDVNGLPTATDKLQVFGDIRVGTDGTNGCIKDFGGNPITGSCSSDRRFKKDITPFGHVLDRLTALQPVHYFWRASEFPDRQFGHRRAYGLIAQDVEQVLPELVVTNADGFKAVDYSALPLLTLQAVKDLKSEVTDLRSGASDLQSENDALKQRVAELERLVNELLTTAARR